MSENKFIERKQRGADSAESFESLKAEGLRLVQELSGSLWTDYNLHDPGVTILDQLCYALTDLMSRTEWETADYLTGEDGGIDFDRQALYRPHQIFPSQAMTINDYRKIFFDAIPEIDNVWVQPERNGPTQGLYRVVVKLLDVAEAEAGDRVVEKVRELYAANRNLGEDLLPDVHIVDPQYYTLHGMVEVDGAREPADILADIYFECARHIGPGIALTPYEDLQQQGKPLEEVLTGPLTRQGYIDEAALNHAPQAVTVSDLIGRIAAIEGVTEVRSLWLEEEADDAGRRVGHIAYDPALRALPYLRIPQADDAIGLRLYKNEKAYPAAFRGFRRRLDRLQAEYQRLRHTGEQFDRVYIPPQGAFRQLRDYYSIQHDFPEIYGVNAYGVPMSAPTRRKAQASQLKAYLLFFEQLMANFLANVDAIPRLFSLDEDLQQTYFFQVLDSQQIPQVEHLYKDRMDQVDAKLATTVGKYDPFVDRRSRILDYLLALYGEKFTQNSLRKFNDYYTHDELEHEVIRNKISFLKYLVEISKNRSGGYNYQKVSWNTDNISALQKKVSILLGFKFFYNRSLIAVFTQKWLRSLMAEDQLLYELEGFHLGIADDEVDQYFHTPYFDPDTSIDKDIQTLFNEISILRHHLLSPSALRNGIDPQRYQIGRTRENEPYKVVFQPDENARWYYLASYPTPEEAAGVANDLRRFFIQIQQETEGVYMVEHLLLRPVARPTHPLSVPSDFYAFQISVIFPSWTARFNDPAFRQLAEETVQLNCPAHIYPVFYWLNFDAIRTFETLYKTWLELMRNRGVNSEDRDLAAERLIAFLLSSREQTTN